MEQRLDQILLRRGYVTEEQIRHGLQRQRARGGRLGTNLLFFKYINEDQLADALAEQYGVLGFHRGSETIDAEVAARIAPELAIELQAIPFGIDPQSKTVRVLMADPADEGARERVLRLMRLSEAKVYVASEATVRRLIDKFVRKIDATDVLEHIVELPELFESDLVATDDPDNIDVAGHPGDPQARVLMVSAAPALKTFLGSIFTREGFELLIASEPEEVTELLSKSSFDHVLVAQESLDDYKQWLREGDIPTPRAEVSVFSSVSRALLDNPVPYERMVNSLLRSLQILVGLRCANTGAIPPYDLMCRDLRRVATELRFRRLAIDGLQIAAHLLVVEQSSLPQSGKGKTEGQTLSLVDFDQSLEMAKILDFPWDVAGALQTFLELMCELRHADDSEEAPHGEVFVASQLLALVWYRYFSCDTSHGEEEERLAQLKTKLRSQAGRLASLTLIEAYARFLEANKHEIRDPRGRQVFLVAPSESPVHALAAPLARVGYRTVHVDDLEEAQRMCERQEPAVMLVDYDHFRERAMAFRRRLMTRATSLFFAYTHETAPSVMIDLIDWGYRDVFAPPFDYDVIAAKISRAVDEQALRGSTSPDSGSFSASLDAFSFVELIQALGQSNKTVRLTLTNSKNEDAVVYLKEGHLVHAVCSGVVGEEAIFRIVRWGEDGRFRVEADKTTSDVTISTPNDAVLLEACRRLDESLV